MTKILSIVIPTYNRSEYLNKQLEWAVKSIANWDEIELIVCDNNSTDNTGLICDKWAQITEGKIIVTKNESNVGLINNYLIGIKKSTSEYVWVIGDDDPILDTTLEIIIKILKNDITLDLLHINHRCIDANTGDIIIPKYYPFEKDICSSSQGHEVVNQILENNHTGAFLFISSNVLKRKNAIDFIKKFPPEEKYLDVYSLYLNLYLACTNKMYFISEPLLDCTYNNSSWYAKYEHIYYIQIPEILLRLKKNGLSKEVINNCLNFQYKNLESFKDILRRIKRERFRMLRNGILVRLNYTFNRKINELRLKYLP